MKTEKRDISKSHVLFWAAAFFLSLSLAAGALWLVDQGISKRAVGGGEVPGRGFFAEPLLQVDPQAELKSFRDQEDKILYHYGKDATQASGTVRVPIDRAMDYVSVHGLPDVLAAMKGGQ